MELCAYWSMLKNHKRFKIMLSKTVKHKSWLAKRNTSIKFEKKNDRTRQHVRKESIRSEKWEIGRKKPARADVFVGKLRKVVYLRAECNRLLLDVLIVI